MRNFLYCLVFPHPTNNHRAHILHPRFLTFLIAFLIFSSLFFSSTLNPLGPRIKAFADVSVNELLLFTNEKRIEIGLSTLSLNDELSIAAQNKASDMFEDNYWAHNAPDGTTPWEFIKGAGYNYVYAGENLAKGFKNSDDVVNAWMASTTHRENLLSPKFDEVGYAVKSGNLNGEETIIVVQEFGSKSVLASANTSSPAPPPNTQENPIIPNLNLSGSVQSVPRLSVSSEIIIFMIIGFIIILAVDTIYIKRNKIVRFAGHNTDHVLFLGVILFIIIVFNVIIIVFNGVHLNIAFYNILCILHF